MTLKRGAVNLLRKKPIKLPFAFVDYVTTSRESVFNIHRNVNNNREALEVKYFLLTIW